MKREIWKTMHESTERIQEEKGAVAAEYALIAGLLSIVMIPAAALLGVVS